MKKSILIFCAVLTTFSLAAFGYLNWTNQKQTDLDLYYQVSNRWKTMTKEELKHITSIADLLKSDDVHTREDYRNIRVDILDNDKDVRDVQRSELGQSEVFTTAQLELLRAIDYSTNLRITALNKRTNTKTGVVENDSLVFYMTIVPEKEAEFIGGYDALIGYLKENSKEKASVITKDKLQPGKVFFTVTKEGTIANVKVVDTSGYPLVDEELVKVTKNMSNRWTPATNSQGEKVDQKLVFFFGLMGC